MGDLTGQGGTPPAPSGGGIDPHTVEVVASSVNYLNLVPSATTNPVEIEALGTDTNIGFTITTKGLGEFAVTDGITNQLFVGNTDYKNTTVGWGAGEDLSTASFRNIALGYAALPDLITGVNNVAVGYQSVVGDNHDLTVGVGAFTLGNGSDASSTTAIGAHAMRYSTNSFNDVAIGAYANGYTTGAGYNTVVGAWAGHTSTLNTKARNSLFGYRAGYLTTTGADNNIMLGYRAGAATTTGSDNIIIGYDAEASSATASYELTIGGVLLGDLTTGLPALNLESVASSVNYLSVVPGATGNAVGLSVAGSDVTASMTLTVKGDSGFSVLEDSGASLFNSPISSKNSLYVGRLAGAAVSSSVRSTYIGAASGAQITTGSNNTTVGYYAGLASSVAESTAIGAYAGGAGATSNTSVGTKAGRYNTGAAHSVLVGNNAGEYQATTGYNVAVGASALKGVSTHTAAYNVCVGYAAGTAFATGANNNTLIGYQAGNSITTGASNILIGYDIDASSATASYELDVGGIISGDLTTGLPVLDLQSTTSSVNYLSVVPSATGGNVEIQTAGSDTNIGLTLTTKGSGVVQMGTHSTISGETVTGYITINDAAGTPRKLAVVA